MYIVSVMIRYVFAIGGGIQSFHAKFAFLMAASCVAPLATVVFSWVPTQCPFAERIDPRTSQRPTRAERLRGCRQLPSLPRASEVRQC